jgi:hypothetical protein
MKAPLLISVVLVAGCNSGHWVDVPILNGYLCNKDEAIASQTKLLSQPVSGSIPGLTPDQVKKDLEDGLTLQGQQACGKAGGTFSGDSRCENGAGQVKCK